MPVNECVVVLISVSVEILCVCVSVCVCVCVCEETCSVSVARAHMLLARWMVLYMVIPRVPTNLSDVRPCKVVCSLQKAAHQDGARTHGRETDATHPRDREAAPNIGGVRTGNGELNRSSSTFISASR